MPNQFETTGNAMRFMDDEQMAPKEFMRAKKELVDYAQEVLQTKGALVAYGVGTYDRVVMFEEYSRGTYITRGTEPVPVDDTFIALRHHPYDSTTGIYQSSKVHLVQTRSADSSYLLSDYSPHTYAHCGGVEEFVIPHVRDIRPKHLSAIRQMLAHIDGALEPVSSELLEDAQLPVIQVGVQERVMSHVYNLRTDTIIPPINIVEQQAS